MSASLSIDRTTRLTPGSQYQCTLTVCRRRRLNGCQENNEYSIIIPEVNNQNILQRPNVLYRYWQKPSSAVELQPRGNQRNCDNIKFYWIMHNNDQGQLIIQYSSTMV